jgi:pectate lyase
MSDGMIPTTGGGTTEKLDALVKERTSGEYTTYVAFRDAYAASCTAATEGNSPLDSTLSKLNSAYGSVISVSLKSNTTLIGKGENCGIKGGAISISGVSNVQVRNLVLQDAYDPFPHHENSDGFNAQHDNICVSGTSKNIWIDHCTLEDTMGLVYVTIQGGSEKWQTYDGLLDMKAGCTNITISNCKFYNHDKTMLIGSGDGDGDSSKRSLRCIRTGSRTAVSVSRWCAIRQSTS